MSSSRAKDNIPGGQRRSYISTVNFTGWFYTYRTEVQDLDVVGIWGQVTEEENQCPKGRILRENGRKLYPGANPAVDAYYVGVYDSVTFLSGFINPNESVFAVFNSDKPVYLADNNYAFDGNTEDGADSEADAYDLGAPVYTKGNIETVDGDIIANAAGFAYDSEYDYYNYITLNDVSGNASAYFGFDGANSPYVQVETDDNTAYGYMEASDITAELYLKGQDISGNDNELQALVGEGAVSLDLRVNYSTLTNSIVCNVTAEEASIEVTAYDLSGNENCVSLYGGDGSIQISGLLNLMNARGAVHIDGSGYGSTINQLLVQSDFVILTRKALITGTQGHLSYNVTDSTLTVHSTEDEDSVINYLILGSPPP